MMSLARVLPLVVLGLASCGSDRSNTGASDSPSTTSAAPTTPAASTVGSTDPTTTIAASMSFTFDGLEGLVAVDDPQLHDDPNSDSTTTMWSSANGILESYLTLRDVPAPAHESPEGDVSTTPIETPRGHAVLVTDNGLPDPPPSSAIRVMWWRGDGRLWIISTYGLTTERLTELALAIEPGPDGTPALTDPSMTLVGFSTSAAYQSILQQWTLDGHNLTLAVTNGGLTQQLSDLPVTSIEEQVIAGTAGYKITLPNAQVNLIWPTDNPDLWASIAVSPTISDRIDEIADAVVHS
jgi:hypothetical protein